MEDYEKTIPRLPQSVLDAIPRKHLDIAYASQSPTQKLDL